MDEHYCFRNEKANFICTMHIEKKNFHNGYWKDYIKNTKCTLSIFSITWYL